MVEDVDVMRAIFFLIALGFLIAAMVFAGKAVSAHGLTETAVNAIKAGVCAFVSFVIMKFVKDEGE